MIETLSQSLQRAARLQECAAKLESQADFAESWSRSDQAAGLRREAASLRKIAEWTVRRISLVSRA